MYLLRRSPFRAAQITPLLNPRSSKKLAIPIIQAIRFSQQKRLYSEQVVNQHGIDSHELGSSDLSESSISDFESLTQPTSNSPSSLSQNTERSASATGDLPLRSVFVSNAYDSIAKRRSFIEPPPSASLFVGNLLFEINDDGLREAFAGFGGISKVKVVYDQKGLSKGHGYVNFDSIESASKARDALNDQMLQGRRIMVQYSSNPNQSASRDPTPPTKTLFLGNIPFNLTDEDLNNVLADISGVKDVRVAIDRRTNQPRGFLHLEFVDVESAKIAKDQLKNREIFGRKIKLDFSRERVATGVKGDDYN